MFFWLNFCSSSISSFKLRKLEMKLTSVYFISHQSIYTLIKVQSRARQQPSSSSSNILQVMLEGADISHVLRDHFCIVYIRWLLREGSTIARSLAWAFLQMKIAAALRGLSSTFVCFDQRLMLNVGLGFFRCFFFSFIFNPCFAVLKHICVRLWLKCILWLVLKFHGRSSCWRPERKPHKCSWGCCFASDFTVYDRTTLSPLALWNKPNNIVLICMWIGGLWVCLLGTAASCGQLFLAPVNRAGSWISVWRHWKTAAAPPLSQLTLNILTGP